MTNRSRRYVRKIQFFKNTIRCRSIHIYPKFSLYF
jgi:hypothetical protein